MKKRRRLRIQIWLIIVVLMIAIFLLLGNLVRPNIRISGVGSILPQRDYQLTYFDLIKFESYFSKCVSTEEPFVIKPGTATIQIAYHKSSEHPWEGKLLVTGILQLSKPNEIKYRCDDAFFSSLNNSLVKKGTVKP